MTIGIALIGAGIFASEQHLPAIKVCASLSLRAIYSRSQNSAETLLKDVGEEVKAYYDIGADESCNLDAMLKRTDIEAVIIALPILVQPGVIRRVMAAGKHVMSEKPIAKDSATAQDLLAFYQPYSNNVTWAVGENFRVWSSVNKAFEILAASKAELVTFSVNFATMVDPKDKYFQTEWRATPGYQGGFLLDGGIHFVAILRYLLSALGQKVTNTSAYTALLQERLSPVDTIHAILEVSAGHKGTFNISFGTEFKSDFEISIVTDKCSVTIRPTVVTTVAKNTSGGKEESKYKIPMTMGVVEEVELFARALQGGKLDSRISPQEAMADLQLLEAMLRSGENGGLANKLD